MTPPLARRGRSALPTVQRWPHCGQGCFSPRSWPCWVVATSKAPSVKPRAAARATSSIWAKSTSSPGPCSPKACLTTIFPHCLASRVTVCNSSGDNFRVAMAWPSLTLEELGKANFRPPILPAPLYGAKGVLHSGKNAPQRCSCPVVAPWLRFCLGNGVTVAQQTLDLLV